MGRGAGGGTGGLWGGLTARKRPQREPEPGQFPFHKEGEPRSSPGKLGPLASTPTSTEVTNPDRVQTQSLTHCRPSGPLLNERLGCRLFSPLQHLACGAGSPTARRTFTVTKLLIHQLHLQASGPQTLPSVSPAWEPGSDPGPAFNT